MGKHKTKIGILTYHDTANYGSFLQCYSLCNYLSEKYPKFSFEVIDYTHPVNEKNKYKAPLLLMRKSPTQLWRYVVMMINFKNALKQLPLSKKHYVTRNYQDLAKHLEKEYDAIIVGADTVLNASRGFPSIYNLPECNVPKFYFAASAHGMRFSKWNEQQIGQWKKYFDEFTYIGVRDSYTEQFMELVSPEVGYSHLLDPTFFYKKQCDGQALKERLMEKYGLDPRKKIIGVMTYSEAAVAALREVYGDTYSIVSLYRHNKFADAFFYDLKPHEWAVVFSMFEFTLTQFFHGTLFSLWNGTPVVCFGRTKLEETQCGKVEDLLRFFELETFFLKAFDFKNKKDELQRICEKAMRDFDKNKIKELFAKGREEAVSFSEAFETIFKKEL